MSDPFLREILSAAGVNDVDAFANTLSHCSKAYFEGEKAAKDGLTLASNPYPKSLDARSAYQSWRAGYDQYRIRNGETKIGPQ